MRSCTSGSLEISAISLASSATDLRRHLRRRGNAEENFDREARHAALGNRRHLRQRRQPLRRRDAQHLGLAACDMRHHRGRRRPGHRNLTGQQVRYRGRRAAIRHWHDLDLGQRVHRHQREMMRRADAGRPGRELARFLPGQRDQLLDVVGGKRRRREQHQRRRRNLRNRGEIRDHVVRHVLAEPLVQRGRAFDHQQRVAVGRRLGDEVGADHAAAGGPVLNDDRLLQPLLQFLGDQPAGGVDAAARADRHDERNGARGVELRRSGNAAWQRQECAASNRQRLRYIPAPPDFLVRSVCRGA